MKSYYNTSDKEKFLKENKINYEEIERALKFIKDLIDIFNEELKKEEN